MRNRVFQVGADLGTSYPAGSRFPAGDKTVRFTGRQEVRNPVTRRGHRLCGWRGMPASLMIDHAAAMLGVSRRTVYYRIREGRLRTVRTMGGTQRVLVDSIAALLREGRLDVTVPAAAASGTDPFAKFPAP